MTYHWSERLSVLNACDDSLEWAATQESPLAAWRSCENGGWLLWIAAILNVDRRLIVTATCQCARLALAHVPSGEDRPLKAIEAAERWVDGLATIKELRRAAYAAIDSYAADAAIAACSDDAAYSAAASAAAAADAAYSAASYAADAAARASRAGYSVARAAYAAYAAADAADSAADYAADAAYAAESAARAAYYDVLRQCADIVRSTISEDVILAAWQDEEDDQ